MNKQEFSELIDNIDTHISKCADTLTDIKPGVSLEELSLSKLRGLVEFCLSEQPEMDKIVTTDLYHIIGMGDMNAVQMSIFIKKVKEYLSYRTVIKTINTVYSKHIQCINTHTIKQDSSYKLTALYGITLHSKGRCNTLEKQQNSWYCKLRSKDAIPFMATTHSVMPVRDFLCKLENGETTCGMSWSKKDGYYIGRPVKGYTLRPTLEKCGFVFYD